VDPRRGSCMVALWLPAWARRAQDGAVQSRSRKEANAMQLHVCTPRLSTSMINLAREGVQGAHIVSPKGLQPFQNTGGDMPRRIKKASYHIGCLDGLGLGGGKLVGSMASLPSTVRRAGMETLDGGRSDASRRPSLGSAGRGNKHEHTSSACRRGYSCTRRVTGLQAGSSCQAVEPMAQATPEEESSRH